MPKKILVLHTGGTISMQADASGAVVTSSDNPMNHVSNPLEGIQVHALDFFNLPSPHIKPKHMLALYQKIKEEADNYDGVVITHGTDTLEETAYFLDTMEVPHMPIVLTGAMRSSNELGSDGVYNYLSALRVASDDRAADKGVLVVMNDEIHAAKYVTKTHTTNVSTFQTPTHGPLGLIMKQEILYFKTAEPRVRFELDHIKGLVPIISAYAGMTDELIDMLDLEQLDGLIIQAFGAGNIPKETAQKLESLLQKGIPVALVSRCFNGIAEPVYAYQGGGVQLQKAGLALLQSHAPLTTEERTAQAETLDAVHQALMAIFESHASSQLSVDALGALHTSIMHCVPAEHAHVAALMPQLLAHEAQPILLRALSDMVVRVGVRALSHLSRLVPYACQAVESASSLSRADGARDRDAVPRAADLHHDDARSAVLAGAARLRGRLPADRGADHGRSSLRVPRTR